MLRSGLRLACLLLCLAGGAAAQPEPVGNEPAAGAASTSWIRPAEVPQRTDDLLRRIEEVRPEPAVEARVGEIEAKLKDGAPALDALVKRAHQTLAGTPGITALEDLRRGLAAIAARSQGFEEQLDQETNRIALALEEFEAREQNWTATAKRPETAAAGDAVLSRVERSRDEAAKAVASLQAWRTRVFDVSNQLVEREALIRRTELALQDALAAAQTSLLVPDTPPIWRSGLIAGARSELPLVPAAISEFQEGTLAYVKHDVRPFLLQGLLALILALLFRAMSARARRLASAEAAFGSVARVLGRPISIALLLALFATPWLQPTAPSRVASLILVWAMLPAARIVVTAWKRPQLPVFAAGVFLLLLERMTSALTGLPDLRRVTVVLTIALGVGLSLWLAREANTSARLRTVLRFAATTLAAALFAEIGGWSRMAALIDRAALTGALLALYLYAGLLSLDALMAYSLRSRMLARVHLVQRHRETLRRQTERLLRLAAGLYWIYVVLGLLTAREIVRDGISALLSAGVSVGALSLSIGGVLAFVLTLVASMWAARLVSAVFEEDIFPRARLPRGIPYALSALTRYAVYSLGFLLALAAAGVELGQLTILLGGLGVGVGLGLQDVVKNFAAGLTLLFERRVHVGDAVQVPSLGVFGRVIAIGMRATLIRSWDGAEVVLPNGDLVSGAVTNWTLSDLMRRIEVPVGVAYGTDPDRVVTLLLEVASGHESLLEAPPPQAIFKGFGESSLDFVLRAWTDIDYDYTVGLTSEVALGVHRALSGAGIVIPFPQRDLHLASVSPEARAAFARPAADGAPGGGRG